MSEPINPRLIPFLKDPADRPTWLPQNDVCLSDMKDILDYMGQEFFLVCGTFLGQHRSNDFIKWDGDIDIGIFSGVYNPAIIKAIINSGKFKLKWVLGKLEESFQLTFIHNNGRGIDIMLFYKEGIDEDYYYSTTFLGICDLKPGKFCKYGNHIRGLKEVMFRDRIYKVPSNAEEYLTESYGDWRTPRIYTYQEGLAGEFKNIIN